MPKDEFRILSLHGGGIRGIVAGQILVHLERKLQELSGDPGVRLSDCLDMVAGTSTGAFLAAGYVCPDGDGGAKSRYSAEQVVNFYLQDGGEIFDVDLWQRLTSAGGLLDEKYDERVLENVLERAFGDTRLSELLLPTCFVAYDVKRREVIIFRQHLARKEASSDFLVRDLLRGSSAAPTFFETARIHSLSGEEYILVDGGMVANDPTLCAYSEALVRGFAGGMKEMYVVSVGTGRALRSYDYAQVKNLGPLGWARPAVDIALEGGPQMVEFHMARINETVGSGHFELIDPELDPDASPDMDDASPANMAALKRSGDRYAQENDNQLTRIARRLVEDRG